MAIVNTFTKLIFGDDVYSAREKSIIDAFQAMEVTVSRGDRREMGEYLRNLGVREMIQLVSGVCQYLSGCARPPRASRVKSLHLSRPV